MGDPKYPRRVWRKPKRPLNYDLKMEELKTLGTFGLRTKRELWKAHTELSRVRHQARSLLALGEEARAEKEPVLLRSLERIGLVSPGSTLDDVLSLGVNDLLARRLQTIVSGRMGFKTPYQARQAVIHGHIMIGDRRVDIPSYTVTVKEEPEIRFAPGSTIPAMLKAGAQAEGAGAEAEPTKEAGQLHEQADPAGAEAAKDAEPPREQAGAEAEPTEAGQLHEPADPAGTQEAPGAEEPGDGRHISK